MPEIVRLQERLGGRDDFALISVSADFMQSRDRLQPVIREFGINYPVLHNMIGTEVDLHDWEIHAFPSAYLINPAGEIFMETHITAGTADWLEALLELDGYLPVTELNVKHELLEGDMHRFRIESDRPLDVDVSIIKVLEEYWAEVDGEFRKVENPPADVEPNVSGAWTLDDWESRRVSLTPDDSGGASLEITVGPVSDENLWAVQCLVSCPVPGLEELAVPLPGLQAESFWLKPDPET